MREVKMKRRREKDALHFFFLSSSALDYTLAKLVIIHVVEAQVCERLFTEDAHP